MSRYSGRQGKGAARRIREQKRREAEERQGKVINKQHTCYVHGAGTGLCPLPLTED